MLAYKMRRLENYRVQAKEKLIVKLKENERLRERTASELEVRVKERTYELEEKNKQLDLFVYKSTHDIRGPLKSIIGLTNISEEERSESELRKYITLIKTCAHTLDRTVSDLLEIGKINHFKDYDKELIQFQNMVHEIKTELLAGMKISFQLNFEIKPNLVFYSVRPLVYSILQNLIENAIRYRDANKPANKLDIIITKEADFIVLTIRDNGIGMDRETINKVFEMFYRAKQDKAGSGLGLYIVKLAVEKLEGQISVQSDPGQGTTFNIKLKDFQV